MGLGGWRQQKGVQLASSTRCGHLGADHRRMAERHSLRAVGVLRRLPACDRHTGFGQRKRGDRRGGADHELPSSEAVELRHV